jgi:hypothetical protein
MPILQSTAHIASRRRLTQCALAAQLLALAGCGNQSAFVLTNTEIQGQAVSDIMLRLRQDLGHYHDQAVARRALPVDPDIPVDQSGHPVKLACDIGEYDFDISKAEVALQISTALKTNGSFGLKVPIFPAANGSIGPDLSGTVSRTATQTVTLDLFDGANTPADGQALTKELSQANEDSRTGRVARGSVTPISDTLIRLRKALIESARSEPCLNTVSPDPTQKPGDSLKLDFVVGKDVQGDVGFNIYVVSLSAGLEKNQTQDNTLTVNFVPITPAKAQSPHAKH